MGLEEKLQLINDTKQQIRNKIIDKGVHVAESVPFKDYPDYIQQIEPSTIETNEQGWEPDPLWWDIETILEEDTNEGEYEYLDQCGKAIILVDPEYDGGNSFVLNQSNLRACKTSDGQLYVATSTSNTTINHTWDISQAKQSSRPHQKTAYMIFYVDTTSNIRHTDASLSNALYIYSKGAGWYNSNSSAGSSSVGGNYLEILRIISGYMSGVSSRSNAFFTRVNVRYAEFNCPSNRWSTAFLNECGLSYLKLGSNFVTGTDETTGLRTYNTDWEVTNVFETVDVTEIDFSDASTNIFTNLPIRNLKGVINLSGNTINTSFNLFRTVNTSMKPYIMNFSVILPQNASVKINAERITPASAKFLAENAPVLTEAQTLTIPSILHTFMKKLPHTHLVMYNGEQYSDAIQVLTLKGWTVATA